MSAPAPIADAELDSLFAALEPFAVLILAVSGGADSLALMHLAARWAKMHPKKGRKLVVATVDHGLRAESLSEARWVGQEARAIGLNHEILTWAGAKPATGLQDAAREARYRLLSELALCLRSAGPVAVVTAHTEDDQAETLLMRLARGSGLDGLTGMSASRLLGRESKVRLVRPLLEVSGARLKATLQARGLSWIEDPSNEADRFERVRLRKARAALEEIGLGNTKIALSARRLERARAVLEEAERKLESEVRLDLHGGMCASFDARAFERAPEELRLRLLARLIAAFGGQDEPARLSKLEALLERLGAPEFEAATLGGAILTRRGGDLLVHREPGRAPLPEITLAPGETAVWDRRFRVAAARGLHAPVRVRALGSAAFAELRRQLEGHLRLPARAGATLPAFWQDGRLIGVPPLAGLPGAAAALGPSARHCSAEFLW